MYPNKTFEQIKSINIRTNRYFIRKERNRLKKTPNEPNFKEWIGNREYPFNWIIRAFGRDFEKTDEEVDKHYEKHRPFCQICGTKFNNLDKEYFVIEFLEPEENYLEKMTICLDCQKLKELRKTVKTKLIKKD